MVSVYYWILDEKALALKKLKEYLSTRPTEANMLETITAQDEDNLYLSKNPLLIEARQALLSAYQAQEKDGGQPELRGANHSLLQVLKATYDWRFSISIPVK